MTDPLTLPDPYKALGLEKDATAQSIKTAYRKAALKCHPDKTSDKTKIDEFHRIQQAYDLLSDDDKRRHYDNTVRLAGLKNELRSERAKYPSSAPKGASRSTSYSYDPRANTTDGWSSRGPTRFEERKPKDDPPHASPTYSSKPDYFNERPATDHTSPRKYETYESAPKSSRSAPKSNKAESIRSVKSDKASEKERQRAEKERERIERERADVRRQKERDIDRRSRGRYGFSNQSDSDSSDEDDYPSRTRATPSSRPQPPPRRSARDVRPVDDDTIYDDPTYQKFRGQRDFVHEYTGGRSTANFPRGSPPREQPPSSYRKPQPAEATDSRRSNSSTRPGLVRRASSSSRNVTTESSKTPPSSRRGSKQDHVEPEKTRRFPFLSKSNTAPTSTLESMQDSFRNRSDDLLGRYDDRGRGRLERSDSMPTRKSAEVDDRSRSGPRAANEARPSRPERSESDRTMPRTTSSRTQPIKSSGLRTHAETPHDSGYSTGYSTGNSPNEAAAPSFPEQKRYAPGAQTSAYTPTTGREAPPPRTTRRTPSPQKSERYSVRREDSYRESAKYASATGLSEDRRAPPPAKSSKTADTGPARRPSLSKTNSQHGSSWAQPSLSRNNTMPAHYPAREERPLFENTAPFASKGGVSGTDGLLYGEQRHRRTLSPEPMSPATEKPSKSAERFSHYDEVQPPRRGYTDGNVRASSQRTVPVVGLPFNSGAGKVKYDPSDISYASNVQRRSSNARDTRAPPTAHKIYEPQPRRRSSAGGSAPSIVRRTSTRKDGGIAAY